MSVSFEIKSNVCSYGVHIQDSVFESIKSERGDAIVMCDTRFQQIFESANMRVLPIDSHEAIKSLDAMSGLIAQMRKLGANRKTTLIAVGGGVIQDIAAFCASIYMRGIRWTLVPTTLLSMVDSCVGGKSSINVGEYKNIVGGFYPPAEIYIDPTLCDSLWAEQWAAGLIEAAKICFAKDDLSFNAFSALMPSAFMETQDLASLIELSLRTKKWFIQIDEFDKKERLLLNFGHTFGHAIEGASQYNISHGVAVGLGCIAALEFASFCGIDALETPRVREYAKMMRHYLALVPDLNEAVAGLDVATLLDRFESDKKHGDKHYAIVTVNQTGHLTLVHVTKSADTRDKLARAFAAVIEEFSGVGALNSREKFA